jgi:hypothetical protein
MISFKYTFRIPNNRTADPPERIGSYEKRKKEG